MLRRMRYAQLQDIRTWHLIRIATQILRLVDDECGSEDRVDSGASTLLSARLLQVFNKPNCLPHSIMKAMTNTKYH